MFIGTHCINCLIFVPKCHHTEKDPIYAYFFYFTWINEKKVYLEFIRNGFKGIESLPQALIL